jgi:tRNA (uracil-5-)-methyltransferase TRM9
MDEKTIERLLTLNQEFYATFSRPFAASRPASDPVLSGILPYIPQRARVLDVGCGNGRLALLLDRERPGISYLGIDAVPELIELARAESHQLMAISAEFRVRDITRPGWSNDLYDEPLSHRSGFDCGVILAVLHHIPSFHLRLHVLRETGSLLSPHGRLILSTWQFLDSARMRRKIVDWAEVDVAEELLEPGDHLLDWKREGRGLRYCHMIDRDEIERLGAESGFRIQETFRAGGREGNLSLFAILRPGS